MGGCPSSCYPGGGCNTSALLHGECLTEVMICREMNAVALFWHHPMLPTKCLFPGSCSSSYIQSFSYYYPLLDSRHAHRHAQLLYYSSTRTYGAGNRPLEPM